MSKSLAVSEESITPALKSKPVQISKLFIEREGHLKIQKALSGQSYDYLLKRITGCRSCPIHQERYFPPVHPKGDLDSYFVVYGRNPGRMEGEQREPFYPKAPGGGILDKYLFSLGVDRKECYLTHSLYCWTSNDRPPTDIETIKCSHWKAAEMSWLIRPKFLFLLGNDAMKSVLSPGSQSIVKTYGHKYLFRSKTLWQGSTYIFPVFHPGTVMRDRRINQVVTYQLEFIRSNYIEPFREFLRTNPSEGDVRDWECSHLS